MLDGATARAAQLAVADSFAICCLLRTASEGAATGTLLKAGEKNEADKKKASE
jgi:hypothetical protein